MYKIFFAILVLFSGVFAQENIPKLDKYATDLTGTLSAQELNDLNYRLKSYEDSTSNQLVVVMIKSLDGNAVDDMAYQIARQNKVGSKKNSNGVVLLVAKDDKKIRIEVGYGLEGALTDAISSSIIRNTISPEFRNGNYYAGISSGVNDIQKAVAGEYKAKSSKGSSKGIVGALVFIFFIIVMIINFFRRIGGGMVYRSGSGFRSGYWGGGGFGGFGGGGSSDGGGFGGFSGGGGDFGGGGSSGSW
ncbi:MAG: TPM domain-containing protein [Bacteroidota bacterium]|nr:TPM domain-containing protein [Bacteroidota bacterium]